MTPQALPLSRSAARKLSKALSAARARAGKAHALIAERAPLAAERQPLADIQNLLPSSTAPAPAANTQPLDGLENLLPLLRDTRGGLPLPQQGPGLGWAMPRTGFGPEQVLRSRLSSQPPMPLTQFEAAGSLRRSRLSSQSPVPPGLPPARPTLQQRRQRQRQRQRERV